jgi:trk system potassium uptake protein TrkA
MSQKKQVCVIGLGQFGREISLRLAEGFEVLAIDHREDRVTELSDRVQRAMVLDARDRDSLATVVSSAFDIAVISMSESLESSILCALHLKNIGIKRIIAKAANRDHASILEALGVDEVIFPERETAFRLAARLANPNLLDFIPLEEGYQVAQMSVPPTFEGHSLKELSLTTRYGIYIVAIREMIPPGFQFLPGPDAVLKGSDMLVALGRDEDLRRLEKEAPQLTFKKTP